MGRKEKKREGLKTNPSSPTLGAAEWEESDLWKGHSSYIRKKPARDWMGEAGWVGTGRGRK